MAETRSTNRYAAMLLVGSVLAVAALVVTGLEKARQPSAQATARAAIAQTDDTDFRKWAADDDGTDGNGRLIGEIERNGKTVELRELPPGAEPAAEQADGGPGSGDAGAGQSDR